MISLTRRYHFSASHRLHSRSLTEEQNSKLYGKCNNPFGHGHNYMLEVTVSGSLDKRTGHLIRLSALDQLVEAKILEFFRYRNLNIDLPYFAELVPTTENVAFVIAGILQENWNTYFASASVRLTRVHIQETDRNGFEIQINGPSADSPAAEVESVQLHV